MYIKYNINHPVDQTYMDPVITQYSIPLKVGYCPDC